MSRSSVFEKSWFAKDCSRRFMNLLHSPRNEHSKTQFGKENSEKKFGGSDTFSVSKFDPATGVTHNKLNQLTFPLLSRFSERIMLLCYQFASASFASRIPSSLSVDRFNSISYTRSAEPHWLRPTLVACPRNDFRRKTLDRSCNVSPDFFQWYCHLYILYLLRQIFLAADSLETLLVATACSCYLLCQAWACFLAFVQHACCHTGASRWSGGQP